MSRLRRVVEGAFTKLDEINAKSDAKALAKLTPAERERYDAWVAHTEAAREGVAVDHPKLVGKVLYGPAGEELHGVTKAPKRPAPIEDPAAWEAQRQAEIAARAQTRAPYLSPTRHPVKIARIAVIPKSQVGDVAETLGSSGLAGRPELVYGVYRVPDVISAGRLRGEPIAEWDIVHAAETALPAAPAPAVLSLAADDVLVARAAGEPAPLDEDLALEILARAGAGPEATLGIAREIEFTKRSSDESFGSLDAMVRGVHVFATSALSAAGAPFRAGPPEGICLDVLQWEAIAKAVHPVRQHRAPLPSPFPYLPLTPQELLLAYLEIVGVSPADAYCAQVTHDRPFDFMGRTSSSGRVRRTGGGPDLPCADGKPRQRMAGGHHIVVAYRDRPEYAEGRARFDAYMETELHAHLRRGVNLRAAVPKPAGKLERTIDRVSDVVEFFTMDPATEGTFIPPRYCWPPSR